jgi:uncharacterized protein YecE (DUF72 family)
MQKRFGDLRRHADFALPLEHDRADVRGGLLPAPALARRGNTGPPARVALVMARDTTRGTASIRIGISGWRYEPWRGTFYPEHLAQRHELAYAASKLPTVEINGSFYSLQRPQSWQQWYEQTPSDFVFGVKGGRYITHMLKLRNVEKPLANFFAQGVLALREKLGPVLWQFPPSFRYDREKFERFFDLLPHDTQAAARLARQRDERMKGRCVLATDENRPVRHAVEIRHESFLDASFIDLLRAHHIALVVAETARRWPMTHDVTADFIYMRLHGDRQLYQSGYGEKALERWAVRIQAWHRGSVPEDAIHVSSRKPPSRRPRDVFCYFDNTDVKLRAPFDAQRLMKKLGVTYRPADSPFAGAPRRTKSQRTRPAGSISYVKDPEAAARW